MAVIWDFKVGVESAVVGRGQVCFVLLVSPS